MAPVRTLPLPLHRPAQRQAPALDLDAQLRVLTDLGNRLDQAHADVAVAVVRCREAGATWHVLGQVLGVGRKTVWNRFGGIHEDLAAAAGSLHAQVR